MIAMLAREVELSESRMRRVMSTQAAMENGEACSVGLDVAI